MANDNYPTDTKPQINDTEDETLKKILKLLDEAVNGDKPLKVVVITT